MRTMPEWPSSKKASQTLWEISRSLMPGLMRPGNSCVMALSWRSPHRRILSSSHGLFTAWARASAMSPGTKRTSLRREVNSPARLQGRAFISAAATGGRGDPAWAHSPARSP